MSRAPVLVRDAVESDASALCLLWEELLLAPGGDVGRTLEQVVSESVERVRGDSSSRIVVAEVDGAVVGCAYLRTGQVSPVHDERVVHLTHLQVDPGAGQQGVDRALVESAVSWAEHHGVDTVVAATSATDRDANRFLARLGLAQVATLRGASVSTLRVRLPHDPSAAARGGTRSGRSVGQVVAARRSQRRGNGGSLLT